MDDRMRKVEGEVNILKDWRSKTVDPHIDGAETFTADMKEFVTIYKTEVKAREKLDDERHRANTFKMNLLLVVGTAFLILLGLLTLIVTYRQTNHSVVETVHPTLADDAAIPPLRGN